MSIACALAFSLTPDFGGVACAEEPDSKQSQETTETVKADSKPAQEYTLEAVTVEAKRPDWESKLSPGTVTIIRPDDYKGEQKTLPEMLKDVPGVHVREVNGKGQYTTVSVRGSTAAQVGVFVDGVLFNLGGDAAADISTIPVKNVERIEVYRGYIPARFGGTYMGGVINIVTKKPSKENISASVGQRSWGGYTASLQVDAPLGTGSLMVGINRDQSDGDFRYKNFQVPYRYGQIAQEFEKLQVAKLADYNLALGFLKSSVGIDIGWAPFKSLEEVRQAATEGSAFYQAVMNKGKALGLSESDLKILFTEEGWFAYDPDFQKKWWDKAMAARENRGVKDDLRWRKTNDYKNTDAIIKWQDDHWTAKATWKKIDRHLPWGLWQDTGYGGSNIHMDLDDWGFMGPRRQELTTKELLVGRRDTVDNLEWGWSVNYLDQDKYFRNEGYDPIKYKEDGYFKRPLSVWSSYDSRRLGGAIDGSYKAGDRHLLEFMVSWSKEKMDVDGWRMTEYTNGNQDDRRRFRNYFEQTLFNIQLQDNITLNKAEDLWFTPSVRYNSSTVLGRSSRLADEKQHIWFNEEDKEKNSKVTWQTALKKKVSDKLTLRSTVGSYYRLLNLYEIAGDGAGILPRPRKDSATGQLTSVFPLPEEGTQWDVSAIWDDRIWGADANIQLTYFGRKSENLLQLYRCGFDYWSYSNAAKGRVNGTELQANLSWDKWDMNLAATYMHTKAQRKFTNPTADNPEIYYDIPQIYSPEWEGSMRLTYRPDKKTSIFTELKYVDEMYIGYGWEKKQKSLTTVGLGVKRNFTKDLQMIVGVNDLFNKGPELRLVETDMDYNGNHPSVPSQIYYPLNPDNPTQGRTYYMTLQYKY